MNKHKAESYIRQFGRNERISDIYDDDETFQTAVNTLLPGFEYPDHSYKTVHEFLRTVL